MTATSENIVSARAAELLRVHRNHIFVRTDRLLAGLLEVEWLVMVILASTQSGRTWNGANESTHPHVWSAFFLGAMIVSLPLWLALRRPGTALTRHTMAAGQMLMSVLLIHVGGGRIEMHFHVFGSLAFLAFYRDWRVLITGSVIVAVDHLLRGLYMPVSVYGTLNVSLWRTLEHASWVIFEDIFLIASCVQAVREMRGIAENRAELEHSHREVEQKIQQRTRELADAQAGLVAAARTAGMAEIATSVLHNVGNVLNSVNVSANVVADKLRQSEVQTLGQVSDLILEHKTQLGEFLTADERGQALPGFIRDLSVCLAQEQAQVLAEITDMAKGIDHIKQIIASQQSMARTTVVQAMVAPAKLIDTAITMQSASRNAGMPIHRTIDDDVPAEAWLDEHKILQILINLLSNARHAVAKRPPGHRVVKLKVSTISAPDGARRLRFAVSDNGVGIPAENLTRIFAHGFTTKADGHGFGLHGAANAAREMDGSLTVHSDGADRGATFTLEVPLRGAPDASSTRPQTEETEQTEQIQGKEAIACH